MAGESRWVVGRIYTGRRRVESFVIEEGRVVSAGPQRATRRDRPTGAERLDARGKVVVPGLIDPHVHPVHVTLESAGVDLEGVRSVPELLARTGRWAETHSSGPIVGRGWDQERFPERKYPTNCDLDRLGGDRPVILYRRCSHVAVVNSRTLDVLRARAGPGASRREQVGRDRRGRPNGLLFEEALRPLRPLVERAVLGWPGALQETLQRALRLGLTTLAPLNAGAEETRWGLDQAGQGLLPVRLRYYLDFQDVGAVPHLRGTPNPDRARLTGVKALLDGSFGARTAWLREPYSDRPAESGVSVWTEEELSRGLAEAVRHGLGLALHAIGDAALAAALDLLESRPDLRPVRLEHVSLTSPDLLRRLGTLGPDVVVQPSFLVGDTWIVRRLGTARARWTYAFRSLLDHGLRLVGSSDAPAETLDPLVGMRAAVNRAPFRLTLESPGPDQRLSPHEALSMYTTSAGATLGEPQLGTLEPGGIADWTVLAGPSLEAAILGRRAGVVQTWVNGTCVYERGGSAGAERAPKL